MIKKTTIVVAFFIATATLAQDSLNVQRLGQLSYSWNLSDVWGYVDTVNNLEYALVGVQDGFSVVDVSVPTNPTEVLKIPGAYSLWRDIKSWSHFAYVCHDYQFSWTNVPNEGIVIVDLDSLQTPRYKKFKPKFTLQNGQEDSLLTAHNLYIDENGVLYVFGASGTSGVNLFNGGALMFDVDTDPWNPIYLGRFDDYYLHDGYARNDVLYAGAVNNGVLAIVDVSLKSNPVILGTKQTPNQFTHNAWLSDDGKYVFTTDEKPSAFIGAYDISSLTNITEVDKIRDEPSVGVIPHNVHVDGDFLVTSYYVKGLQMVDAAYPDLMVEVGYYDTSPNYSGNDGFHGAWGAYPFLPSGNILVTDMEEGLYVLTFNEQHASRIYGIVKDSLTGTVLSQATINMAQANISFKSNLNGNFKQGFTETFWDTLEVSKLGYQTRSVPVQLVAGQYDTVSIALLPFGFDVDEFEASSVSLYPNPSTGEFVINLTEKNRAASVEVSITNAIGAEVGNFLFKGESELRVMHNLPTGLYVVTVISDQVRTAIKLLVP